jgi:hypothetical protein
MRPSGLDDLENEVYDPLLRECHEDDDTNDEDYFDVVGFLTCLYSSQSRFRGRFWCSTGWTWCFYRT